MICNYKTVKHNWHMRRTYILVEKWSFMPPKDRRLTVFMLVRIICLKEKGQNIGVRSPHFDRFDVVVLYVYLQCKVFS